MHHMLHVVVVRRWARLTVHVSKESDGDRDNKLTRVSHVCVRMRCLYHM